MLTKKKDKEKTNANNFLEKQQPKNG